jgi:hypothetical protein
MYKPSKLEELLSMKSGRISCALDWVIEQMLPHIRSRLAMLDVKGRPADQYQSAYQDLLSYAKTIGSLCRAGRNGHLSEEHQERYFKVLRIFRPFRRRMEAAGVRLSPAILLELERYPTNPNLSKGPRFYPLELLIQLLRKCAS